MARGDEDKVNVTPKEDTRLRCKSNHWSKKGCQETG